MTRPPDRRHLAHAFAAVIALPIALGVVLAVVNPGAPAVADSGMWHLVGQLALAVLFAAAGWLLAVHRPSISYGWLALAAGLGHALAAGGFGWAIFALTGARDLPGASAGVVAGFAGEPLENLAVVAFLTTFPSAHLPRGRLRGFAVAAIALCGLGWALGLVTKLPADADYPGLRNPLGVLPADTPVGLLFALGLLIGSTVIVFRWLGATGRERQVLRWLAVVNVAAIALTPAIVLLPAGEVISAIAVAVELAVVVTVVLAHQMYGIETALNRTLVYVVLLGAVALVYAGCIGVAAAFGHRGGDPWAIGAAFVAALALAPARSRIQRLVNTFLYGNRDEPFTVVSRVADRLEAAASVEHLLPNLLDAITFELRLPWARVELNPGDGEVRRFHRGATPDNDGVRFDLTLGHGDTGALAIGLRSGQQSLSAGEHRLLRNIAAQLGVAARNVLLAEALVRSRERVVAAAEDERLRIRRDLHDGLGPVLTAAAIKLDAASNLFRTDAGAAHTVLVGVRDDLGTALEDLRRLVYALHPPVLDELGLLESLRQQLPRMGVPVTLTAPPSLPPLRSAVAVAAYRIVGEAVTNAARHARASRCTVLVQCNGSLRLEIQDDGVTLAPWTPGLGLTSMQERAGALGGSCSAGPTPTGGLVVAELPT